LRQQFFYYNDFSSFNFASFDAIAGLSYSLPQLHNLILRANIDYNRLTGTDDFSDFFSNYALNFSAEVPIPVGRAQQLSFGATPVSACMPIPRRRSAMTSVSSLVIRLTSAAIFPLALPVASSFAPTTRVAAPM